jgi:hypothetical protein
MDSEPKGHVTAGRTPAHETPMVLPSSLSYAEVKIQQVTARTERVLEQIRQLRRDLEPFNSFPLGNSVNVAENEVTNILHRLRRH